VARTCCCCSAKLPELATPLDKGTYPHRKPDARGDLVRRDRRTPNLRHRPRDRLRSPPHHARNHRRPSPLRRTRQTGHRCTSRPMARRGTTCIRSAANCYHRLTVSTFRCISAVGAICVSQARKGWDGLVSRTGPALSLPDTSRTPPLAPPPGGVLLSTDPVP